MFRPTEAKMFEALNPEHSLVDAMTQEIHILESPELYYWSVIKPEKATAENLPGSGDYLDELDQTYGEKSSGDGKLMFRDPVRMYGKLETNPIIAELTKMGLAQIEQVELYINIALAHELLNESPKGGDFFGRANLIRGMDGTLKKTYTFYEVGVVNPVDLYCYQYINYQLEAEQTSMDNIPDSVRNFLTSEFQEEN